jgi:photosystem II stability/assembly factor-like uncharacterized protein
VADHTTLDQRLADGRRHLVDSIEQPPLAQIAGRAATIRRRRRMAGMGGTLTAVLAVMLFAVQSLQGVAPSPPSGRGSAPPPPVWKGLGITLTGLAGTAPDLPGRVVDVEFADTDRGYLLTLDCASACRIGFATTVDGGRSWQVRQLPSGVGGASADRPPRLWAAGTWAVVAGDGPAAYASTDGGATWMQVRSKDENVVSMQPGPLLWLDTGSGQIRAWLPDGEPAILQYQPEMTVRWVSGIRSGDGSWWAGGVDTGGRPALAVSHDGGASWPRVALPDAPTGGYEVRVATLGQTVYAAVLGPPGPAGTLHREIRAIYRSTDGGANFTRTFSGGVPGTVVGDLVPLVDDRLLLAGSDHHWYVSADGGATFRDAPDLLPVGHFARTPAGYVAYDLLGGGWCAFSADGSNWFKLNVK